MPQAEPTQLRGGWWLLADGRKIQGRSKAYKAAGLKPPKHTRKKPAEIQSKKKQSEAEIELRRSEVGRLLLQKHDYRSISQKLGVSIGTVASDVQHIREAWRESAVESLVDHVHEEIQAIDLDERKLRHELEELDLVDPEYTDKGSLIGSVNLIDEKMKVYDRIIKLRERRAKLLGLDAPDVRRILGADDDPQGGELLTFVAAGTEDNYIENLKAAQGQQDRKLRVVSE